MPLPLLSAALAVFQLAVASQAGSAAEPSTAPVQRHALERPLPGPASGGQVVEPGELRGSTRPTARRRAGIPRRLRPGSLPPPLVPQRKDRPSPAATRAVRSTECGGLAARKAVPPGGMVNGGMTRSACGTLTASRPSASMMRCFQASLMRISVVAKNRVPRLAPWAPSINAAAMPRPSAIPPAATTGTSPATSTTAGTRAMVEIQPELPPASLPCATRTSEPASSASSAARLSPTVWIHRIPRSCARAIKSAGTGSVP